MRSLWPVAVVVVAFAAIGLTGALRPAPGDSADARAARAKLNAIPLQLGAWRGVATEVPAKHLQIAEAQAHLSRTYTRGADRVSVLVLAGAPGPLGAHTPRTCFAGVGYELDGVAAARRLRGGAGSLWVGQFSAPPPRGASCEVAWGWGDGTSWVAAEDPRFEFARRNLLYKLYVSRGIGPPATDSAAIDEFLAAFLPAFAAAPEPTRDQ